MHRFYIPDLPRPPEGLTLTDGEAAHAIKVLRVQPGEQITVLDGRGTRVLARVLKATRKEVRLDVEGMEETEQPGLQITLFQSVIKPKAMDWLIEKATELGVHRIQPILTERVVSRIEEKEASKKMEKWRRTAIEALKQCGGLWLPRIEAPSPLPQVIQRAAECSRHFVASLSAGAPELRQSLETSSLGSTSTSSVQVGIWIGPEGDFSPGEINALRSAGAVPITLGDNVLRSETAAICALTLIVYELRLMRRHIHVQQ